jgi:prepilin-type N-terminal cleavage/methylation domain-containing protein
MRRLGFTLAEVLVSIAIISILAALVFSVASKARNSAKATTCVSNLRQIWAAMQLYRQDYGEYPPSRLSWKGFRPYYGYVTFHCPARPFYLRPEVDDYAIHATFRDVPSGSNRDKACMAERGPEYPIAHDENHASTTAAYAAGTRFYLWVRADGSTGRALTLPFQERMITNRPPLPCPRASHWSNF